MTEAKSVTISPAAAKGDLALEEFKAGMVRSMKQHKAGLVKTFDNEDDFLADLHK